MIVLLVEDDPLIALDLEAILFDAGYVVRGPAPTASRAMEMAESGARPTLALVDINLRDGDGRGIALARDLKERWSIPSIFVSGQAAEARSDSGGAMGIVGKPFTPALILASIRAAVRMIGGEKLRPSDMPPGFELFDRCKRDSGGQSGPTHSR